ncbi:MAG: hypothetical protein LBD97_07035, partial [Bifidobacteriaceae bacterium]|nr:hypothetical protein [Bifidobacteriaceae bacterium]
TPDPAEKARRSAHLRLVTSLGPRWLPFDTVAAEGYAEIAAAIHRRRPAHARSRDALLAGHARALGASIATFNAGDFELVRDLVPIVEPRRLA